MKYAMGLLAVALTINTAYAENRSLELRGQNLRVSFDVPPGTSKVKEVDGRQQYQYIATSGRYNVSLFVSPPECSGGVDAEANLNCILPKLSKMPGFVKESVSIDRYPNGIQLGYVAYVPFEGKGIKVLNVHMLFESGGKWGDLHASMVKPSMEEMASLLAMSKSLNVSGVAQHSR